MRTHFVENLPNQNLVEVDLIAIDELTRLLKNSNSLPVVVNYSDIVQFIVVEYFPTLDETDIFKDHLCVVLSAYLNLIQFDIESLTDCD